MSVELRISADQTFRFAITDCPPSIAVIEAVAHVTGQDPLDIEPIVNVIDADAMDRLLSSNDDVTVSFVFEGNDVQVFGSREIVVSTAGPES